MPQKDAFFLAHKHINTKKHTIFLDTQCGGGDIVDEKMRRMAFAAERKERMNKMKTTTKALLFGGCMVTVGIANVANAEITWGGGVYNWYNHNYYSVEGLDEFQFNTPGGISFAGDQEGFIIHWDGMGDFSNYTTFISDVDVEWTFLAEGVYGNDAKESLWVYKLDSGGSQQIANGGTFTLLAGQTYALDYSFNWGQDIVFGVVPAPGALALLGLAGVATRRRRK